MAIYYVYTVDDLQNISSDLTGTYYLMNNIDASATSTWNGGLGFLPLGKSTSGFKFTGKLYGGNWVISNLYVASNYLGGVGLFDTCYGATLDGITISSATITGVSSTAVGGLVGIADNSTVITNCKTSGTVSGVNRCGGLVGQATNSTAISSCSSSVNVTITTTWAGGLVGDLIRSSITDCYATGNISGGNQNGGLIGTLSGASGTVSVTNSYATGSVSASTYSGGLIGIATRGTGTANVKNSYATGVATGSTKGGLLGQNNLTTPITLTNCWWYNATNTLGVGQGSSTGVTKATATSDFYSSSQSVYTGTPAWNTSVWRWTSTYPKLGVLFTPVDIVFKVGEDSLEEIPVGSLGTVLDIVSGKYGTDLLCQEYVYVPPVVYAPLDILTGHGTYDRLLEEIPELASGETMYGYVV